MVNVHTKTIYWRTVRFLVNVWGRILKFLGFRTMGVSIDEESLLSYAESQTKLHNFGRAIHSEPLHLVDSFLDQISSQLTSGWNEDDKLTLFGRKTIRESYIGY